MSNFNHIPDDNFAPSFGSPTERVCQTCSHCTWDSGNKCRKAAVLGLEHDTALEQGLNILIAYRLCRGIHWNELELDE